MRSTVFATVLLLVPVELFAQQGDIVGFTDTGSNFEIQWDTSVGYNYQLDVAMDFTTWIDTGIVEPGTGSNIAYAALVDDEGLDEAKLFFRVRETFDDYDGEFLDLPTENQVIELIDGVRFGFDLMEFPALPARIRVYVRDASPGEGWDHIGTLTEFAEIDGIRFTRGSTVWLPDDVGNYEVRVAVVDTNDAVIAVADRSIVVAPNLHPTVEFLSGPSTSATNRVWAQFSMQTSNDAVRVEYYDNGVLIGSQKEGHFGDVILESSEDAVFFERGTHTVSAIAFDARGLTGQTTTNYVIEVTGGNARPHMEILSPHDGFIVQKGQTVTIGYNLSDPDGSNDLTSVRVEKVFGGNDFEVLELNAVQQSQALTVDTTSLAEGTHTLKVYATDASYARSYPRYLKIYVTGSIPSVFAGTLATNMIDSTSITISNETFAGIEASSGSFVGGLAAGMQIDAGVLLTSGSFGIWNGGDLEENMDEGEDELFFPKYREPGDLVLELMGAGDHLFDAATLGFGASCDYSQLEFEFQFGSEEYVEWVSSRSTPACRNDVFLLSVDGTPVSLLPDESNLVSVLDIHPAAASSCAGSVAASHEELYIDDDEISTNATSSQVEYDGMTIRMRAHVLLSNLNDKRIRLSIGDVNDDEFDSGLFIEGSSVRSVSPAP